MKLRILNDTHIGAIRSAGTTPITQWALRQHILSEFGRLLPQEHEQEDCMILGDLFDTHNVPLYDFTATVTMLDKWLVQHPNNKLYNVLGNHDASKTSNILSSFQALGSLLSRHTNYVHIEEPQETPYGYVIPHVRNQELFDYEVLKMPSTDYLFVHCNYDNHFAAQADQSLNLSAQQVAQCPARLVVFAHEHHARREGKVIIPGNQIATSVADWIPPKDKGFLVLEPGQDLTDVWIDH